MKAMSNTYHDQKQLAAILVAFSFSAGRIGRCAAALAFLYALMEGAPKRRIVSVLLAAAALLTLCSALLPGVPSANMLLLLVFLSYALLTLFLVDLRRYKGWLLIHLMLCLTLCILYLLCFQLAAPGLELVGVAQLAQYDRIEHIVYWVNLTRCLLSLWILLPFLKRHTPD